MTKVPTVPFSVNKDVNLFYHVSVLFSEYFPSEYCFGILNNAAYVQRHRHLRTDSLHEKFQQLWKHAYFPWDFIGISLAQKTEPRQTSLGKTTDTIMDTWLQILSEAEASYDAIWRETEPRLTECKINFEKQWTPIHDQVLATMADISKLPWKTESINVQFVDCIRGAASYPENIFLPPFPELDVQKKLFAHELAHAIILEPYMLDRLRELGVDHSVAHTIVDFVAYFSVKDHLMNPEKRGMKPNPSYYAHVEELFPIFQKCYEYPRKITDFDAILSEVKATLESSGRTALGQTPAGHRRSDPSR